MTYKGERKDGLGLQWQWNHNPVHEKWSLTERKGWLTLEALPAPQLMLARNTLSQKVMGYAGEATTQLDASAFAESTRAGLCVLGSQFAGIGICKKNGKLQFYTEVNGQMQWLGNASKTAYLRVNVDGTRFQLEYSSDGKHFAKTGDAIDIHAKYWKGPRL
jgi:beta-xylosidase